MNRRIALILVLALGTLTLGAQTPADKLDLSELTFVRQGFCRNFYNSSKVMSSLNMDGTDLYLPNSANLILSGEDPVAPVQKGNTLTFNGGRTVVRVGAFHPYLCYEASFSAVSAGAGVGISFTENEGSGRIDVMYRNGAVHASKDGKEMRRVEVGNRHEISLRVQYTGARFHVFILGDGGVAKLLMSESCDMRAVDLPVKWSFGVSADVPGGGVAVLTKARSLLSCGTGQADPQIIQNSDGSPLVRDGRLWVAFTTRGFEQIPDSYQGVYSIDLDSYELRLEGALFFGDGDGIIHGYHATKIVWDGKSGKYLVMTTSHGGHHTLAWSETTADLLHGIHYLECTELEFPHDYMHGGGSEGRKSNVFGTEDPDFFFDAKARKWRLAYCAKVGQDESHKKQSYYTFLCESKNWNGPYRQIARSTKDNNTGIRITTVGGRRYVLSGGSETTFYIYDYPSLDYIGTFNQLYANGGFRGWPTIVPLRSGNYERYLWITFDRGALTGRYSYGTLYFYLADKMWRCE